MCLACPGIFSLVFSVRFTHRNSKHFSSLKEKKDIFRHHFTKHSTNQVDLSGIKNCSRLAIVYNSMYAMICQRAFKDNWCNYFLNSKCRPFITFTLLPLALDNDRLDLCSLETDSKHSTRPQRHLCLTRIYLCCFCGYLLLTMSQQFRLGIHNRHQLLG